MADGLGAKPCPVQVSRHWNLHLPCLLPAGHPGQHATLSDEPFHRSVESWERDARDWAEQQGIA